MFPLCGTRGAQGIFAEAIGQQWGGASEGYSRHAGFDHRSDHPFNDFLADVCQGRGGYSAAPVTGAAIMFDSVVPGSSVPYNRTWHAGCNVLTGTKIILQKFKELPYEERIRESAAFRGHAYHPYNPNI